MIDRFGAQSADVLGYARPPGQGFRSITADLRQHMQRYQEIHKNVDQAGLPSKPTEVGFTDGFQAVRVKAIEDAQLLLVTVANIGIDEGAIRRRWLCVRKHLS